MSKDEEVHVAEERSASRREAEGVTCESETVQFVRDVGAEKRKASPQKKNWKEIMAMASIVRNKTARAFFLRTSPE